MRRTLAARLALLVPVLFLVSIGTFLLVALIPGDPALQVLGPNSTAQEYDAIRREMGLDRPLVERYLHWLGGVFRGDFGTNLVPPVSPVWDRLGAAVPINIELAVLALAIALVVSIPLAIVSAQLEGRRFDRIVTAITFGAISVPSFLVGILLVLAFAVKWQVLPLGQWARPTSAGWIENLRHAALPALTLAVTEIAVFTRLLRGDLVVTLQENFILAARARGYTTTHVLLREALRPSSFSLLTLAGVSFGRLIGGSVVVEQLFALPGLGRTIVDAARRSDYTLVQGGVLLIAVCFVLVNLGVDVLYAVIDPRIRRGSR